MGYGSWIFLTSNSYCRCQLEIAASEFHLCNKEIQIVFTSKTQVLILVIFTPELHVPKYQLLLTDRYMWYLSVQGKAALSDKYETGGFVLILIFWSKHRKAVIGYLCWKQANSSKRVNVGKHQVWPNYPNQRSFCKLNVKSYTVNSPGCFPKW